MIDLRLVIYAIMYVYIDFIRNKRFFRNFIISVYVFLILKDKYVTENPQRRVVFFSATANDKFAYLLSLLSLQKRILPPGKAQGFK